MQGDLGPGNALSKNVPVSRDNPAGQMKKTTFVVGEESSWRLPGGRGALPEASLCTNNLHGTCPIGPGAITSRAYASRMAMAMTCLLPTQHRHRGRFRKVPGASGTVSCAGVLGTKPGTDEARIGLQIGDVDAIPGRPPGDSARCHLVDAVIIASAVRNRRHDTLSTVWRNVGWKNACHRKRRRQRLEGTTADDLQAQT